MDVCEDRDSDPGVVGWGDCTDWGSPGPVAATIERYSEWVIGRDPMQAEAIWWDLSTASMRHVGGIAWKAMSGIDSALWDIRGKCSTHRCGSFWAARCATSCDFTGHIAARRAHATGNG